MSSTHRGKGTRILASGWNYHLFKYWFAAFSIPCHNVNQYCFSYQLDTYQYLLWDNNPTLYTCYHVLKQWNIWYNLWQVIVRWQGSTAQTTWFNWKESLAASHNILFSLQGRMRALQNTHALNIRIDNSVAFIWIVGCVLCHKANIII